jgi:peptidoglycan/xylan/chitin deacetylase (PgdA/CDA1 family)
VSDLLVLCYHAVSERWPASLSVTPHALAEQLGFVVRRGYRGVTFTEAVTQEAEGRRVAVTFDDAYESVLGLAFPILERLGLTATVFVPTAFADSGRLMSWPGVDVWLGTEHQAELAGMSWDALGRLAEEGWELGSHTRTHARLPDLDDAALHDELTGSKEACERRLGTPCRAIAYPYGAVDDRVVAAVARAGYVAAATLPESFADPAPLRWPRVGVFHKDGTGRFRLKASTAVRRARRSPAWTALERVRRRS